SCPGSGCTGGGHSSSSNPTLLSDGTGSVSHLTEGGSPTTVPVDLEQIGRSGRRYGGWRNPIRCGGSAGAWRTSEAWNQHLGEDCLPMDAEKEEATVS